MGTVQRRVNAGQPPHFSQKDFNTEDSELSNKLSKAKRSFLSNNENVVIKKGFKDLQGSHSQISLPGFGSIIMVFDTWLLQAVSVWDYEPALPSLNFTFFHHGSGILIPTHWVNGKLN